MSKLDDIRKELRTAASQSRSESAARFFKTGPGQYGEGDIFIGISVPEQRTVARRYMDLGFSDLQQLLNSDIHEERLTALIILVAEFRQASQDKKEQIYKFYLSNLGRVNNWDLVDASAHYIVGSWLVDKDKSVLYELARSSILWERRVAIVSTYAFIKLGESKDALEISQILLKDKEDLIQKAVGWMIREVGKCCSQEVEEQFLALNYRAMPRTMLRYAIERFPEELRTNYLTGKV